MAALLLVLVVLVYAPARNQAFVDYDDPVHVTENPAVQQGLTAANIGRAFTTSTSSIWMPVTYLSHALDCQLFGLNPAGHKATNIVLHALNAALLFIALHMMTGSLWASAFVAALFGIHPLNVETVAWVSERKNLTSTLFFFLTLIAYVRYVRAASVGRYVAVLCWFALSLMSKPMMVTLPFLLMLLDYWPLQRGRRPFVRDKIPMLALVVAVSIVAVVTQRADAAMAKFETLSLQARALNALHAYAMYLFKAVWPANLAAFYPHPATGLSKASVALSAAALALISAAVVVSIRRLPSLFVGWSWYLGTLVPVIGLVQIGSQAMADRYAYVPLVGVFIMVAWGAATLVDRLRIPTAVPACAALVAIAALGIATRAQLATWNDSMALWTRALSVTGDGNAIAHFSMGRLLFERGRTDEGMDHLRRAAALAPELPEVRYNYGVALQKEGHLDQATTEFEAAIALRPSYLKARNNLGAILMQLGRSDAAADQFQAALETDPQYAAAHLNLARILAARGDATAAIDHYERALQSRPPPNAAQRTAIAAEIEKLRR